MSACDEQSGEAFAAEGSSGAGASHASGPPEPAGRRDERAQRIAAVAGDFNNALSVIVSNAAFAEREIAAGSSPALSVEEIARAARRAERLASQLVDLALGELAAEDAPGWDPPSDEP